MVKQCPNCGASAVDDQSIFCNKCGTQLSEEPINNLPICNKCGSPAVDEKALFCNRCGNSIQNQQKEKIPINNKPQLKPEKIEIDESPKKYAHIPLVAENTEKKGNPQDEKISFNKIETLPKRNGIGPKRIQETRCTCSACGKVWYYGKKDVYNNVSKQIRNAGKTISGASCCCWPMSYMNREETDMGKCPSCGSKAVIKEQITHEVG
jgi:DNA-directed RNA polymerase subunit RPC12/RpoP